MMQPIVKIALRWRTWAAMLMCIGIASCNNSVSGKNTATHREEDAGCFPVQADLANTNCDVRVLDGLDPGSVPSADVPPGWRFTVLKQEVVIEGTSTRYPGTWLEGTTDWGNIALAFSLSGGLSLAEEQVGKTLYIMSSGFILSECNGSFGEPLRYGDFTVRDADGRLLIMTSVVPASPTGEILPYTGMFPEGTFHSVDVGCPPDPRWPEETETALRLTDATGTRTWTAKRGEVVEVELEGTSYLLAPMVVRRRTANDLCTSVSFALARTGFIVGGGLPE